MRIYALYDESLSPKIRLAYIFYYPRENDWYIEISDEVSSHWELPFILDHFFETGCKTVDAYWSRKFVEQRIVPPDRQNLAAILKNCKLDSYDEFALFEIADGRCAQDDCYIEKISITDLPESIVMRRQLRIQSATLLENSCTYLVTLRNGTVGLLELEKIKKLHPQAERALMYYHSLLEIIVGHHGTELSIQGGHSISYEIVSENLKKLALTTEDLRCYAENEIISTGEAMELLNCTRQNLDDLVKRGRLKPAKIKGKSRMYFRSDLLTL